MPNMVAHEPDGRLEGLALFWRRGVDVMVQLMS